MLETGAATKPPAITAHIDDVVANVPGWTPPDQLLALHMLAITTAHLAGDIMEIGSWCGRSAAVLGHAAAITGDRVWAIDLFPRKTEWKTNPDGTHFFVAQIDGQQVLGCEQPIWDEPFKRDIVPIYNRYDSVLDAFNATVGAYKLDQTVSAFRGNGPMFAKQAAATLKVRLAFLDGDHSYEAVCSDIDSVERFLLPGGWIAFDDAFSVYEGIDAAIRDRILGSNRYQYPHQISRKCFVARLK